MPDTQIPPLTYEEFQKVHQGFGEADPYFANMPSREFSRFLNKHLGAGVADIGDVSPITARVMDYGAGLNRLIKPTQEALSEKLGGGTFGTAVGHALPRSVVDLGPMAGAHGASEVMKRFNVGPPWLQGVVKATGYGLSAANMFAGSTEETGSPIRAAGETGLGLVAMPRLMKAWAEPFAKEVSQPFSDLIAPKVGAPIAKAVEHGLNYVIPTTGALTATGEASSLVRNVGRRPMSEWLYNPASPESLAGTAANLISFAPFEAGRVADWYHDVKSYNRTKAYVDSLTTPATETSAPGPTTPLPAGGMLPVTTAPLLGVATVGGTPSITGTKPEIAPSVVGVKPVKPTVRAYKDVILGLGYSEAEYAAMSLGERRSIAQAGVPKPVVVPPVVASTTATPPGAPPAASPLPNPVILKATEVVPKAPVVAPVVAPVSPKPTKPVSWDFEGELSDYYKANGEKRSVKKDWNNEGFFKLKITPEGGRDLALSNEDFPQHIKDMSDGRIVWQDDGGAFWTFDQVSEKLTHSYEIPSEAPVVPVAKPGKGKEYTLTVAKPHAESKDVEAALAAAKSATQIYQDGLDILLKEPYNDMDEVAFATANKQYLAAKTAKAGIGSPEVAEALKRVEGLAGQVQEILFRNAKTRRELKAITHLNSQDLVKLLTAKDPMRRGEALWKPLQKVQKDMNQRDIFRDENHKIVFDEAIRQKAQQVADYLQQPVTFFSETFNPKPKVEAQGGQLEDMLPKKGELPQGGDVFKLLTGLLKIETEKIYKLPANVFNTLSMVAKDLNSVAYQIDETFRELRKTEPGPKVPYFDTAGFVVDSKGIAMSDREAFSRFPQLRPLLEEYNTLRELFTGWATSFSEAQMKWLWKRNGMPEDLLDPGKRSPYEVQRSTHAVAVDYYQSVVGLNPEAAKFLADQTLRLVATFRIDPRIVVGRHLTSTGPLGEAVKDVAGAPGMVGISSQLTPGTTIEGAIFDFSQTLTHELTHQMRNAMGSLLLPPTVSQALTDIIVHANRLTPDEKRATMVWLMKSYLTGPATLPGRKTWAFDGESFKPGTATIGLADEVNRRLESQYRTYGNADDTTSSYQGNMEFVCDFLSTVSMSNFAPRGDSAAVDMARFGIPEVRGMLKEWFGMLQNIFQFVKSFFRLGSYLSKNNLEIVDHMLEKSKLVLRSYDEAQAEATAFLDHYAAKTATVWEPLPIHWNTTITKVFDQANDLWGINKTLTLSAQEGNALELARATTLPQDGIDPNFGLGKRLWIFDFLKPMYQFAKDHPEAIGPIARVGDPFRGKVTEAMFRLRDTMLNKEAGYSMDKLMKLAKDTTGKNKAISDIMRRQNEPEGGGGDRLLSAKECEQLPSFAKLSETDKAEVRGWQAQLSIGVKEAAFMLVESSRWEISHFVGRLAQLQDRRMKGVDAGTIGRAVVDLNLEPDKFKHPEIKYKAIETLAKLDPEFVKKLEALVVEQQEDFANFRKLLLGEWVSGPPETPWNGYFKGKPGYSPESRPGQWAISWDEPGGKQQYEGFKTKGEFQRRWRELETRRNLLLKSGVKEKMFLASYDRTDREGEFKGINRDVFDAYSKITQRMLNHEVGLLTLKHPENAEILKELQDNFQPSAIAKFAEPGFMRPRHLVGGRETLNMIEGMVHYMDSVAYTTSKRFAKGLARLELNDPALVANPQLQKWMRRYVGEIINPAGKEATFLKWFAFYRYLGFNPSQSIVELTQMYTSHIPYLIQAGMPIGKAYYGASKALVDTAKAIAFNKGKYSDPVEDKYVTRAINENAIDPGWFQEMFHAKDDLEYINLRNMVSTDWVKLDMGQLLRNPVYHTLKWMRNMYSLAPRWDSEAGFLSAFRHFRTTEKDLESAYQKAKLGIRESFYGGGKATRPLFFLVGPLGSYVGGIMYILQSFTYSNIAQMSRYVKNSINMSLPADQRHAAMKGAAAMITTQAVLAGVLGLPFTGQILGLIEQMFPGMDVRNKWREWWFGLAGDNEKLGRLLSDASMDGVFAFMPVDASSRFQLSGMLGVDPYHGFSWNNVVGPTGDMIENLFTKVPQAASAGNWTDAAGYFMPNSLARTAKLVSDGLQSRNAQDRLEANMSGWDAAATVLGFVPKAVKEHQNLEQAVIRAQKTEAFNDRVFNINMAKELLAGRGANVKTALVDRAKDPDRHYDPVTGAKQIADLALNMKVPFDPTRTMAQSPATLNAAKVFGPPPDQISEMQREMQKFQYIRQMGIPVLPDIGTLRNAAMVDSLRRQYPGMTVAGAKLRLAPLLHTQEEGKKLMLQQGGTTP